jgi:hypothetical protein
MASSLRSATGAQHIRTLCTNQTNDAHVARLLESLRQVIAEA